VLGMSLRPLMYSGCPGLRLGSTKEEPSDWRWHWGPMKLSVPKKRLSTCEQTGAGWAAGDERHQGALIQTYQSDPLVALIACTAVAGQEPELAMEWRGV
jgi:hypothetical protein